MALAFIFAFHSVSFKIKFILVRGTQLSAV